MHTHVANHASRDLLLRSDLLSVECTAEHADNWNEGQDTVQNARLANCFRYLTSRVAWTEVGDYTDAAVVEATTQTVLEICRHDYWSSVHSS